MLSRIFAVLMLALCWAVPAHATFTLDQAGTAIITNGGFEAALGAEWACNNCSTLVLDTATVKTGINSLKTLTGTSAVIQQQITVTPNTAIPFYVKVRDGHASKGATLRVRDASYDDAGNTLCTVSDTVSNSGVWTLLTCTVPDTNTASTLYLQFVNSGTTMYFDDASYGAIAFTLPSGSTGRRVSLYDPKGDEVAYGIAGDTSVTIAEPVGSGTYYWRITDTDGAAFLDNTAFVTVGNADSWSWTNASLSKEATWGLVSVGNETDGYAMKLQRNGADYGFFGPALGANLAAGKTASASSSYSGTCGQDGSVCNANDGLNTRWLTTAAAPQWVCIDLASAQSFNRVHLTTWTGENYGGRNIKIQSSDTDCSTDMVDVSGTGGSVTDRPQKEALTVFTFTTVTKRYARVYFSSVYGRAELVEVEVYYDDGASNPRWGIDQLVWRATSESGYRYLGALKFTALTNEPDGSVTLSRTLTQSTNTLGISVNYKLMSPNVWRKRYTITPNSAGYLILRDALQYSSSLCFKNGSQTHGACVTANNDTAAFQTGGVGTPYIFGQTADNGCNAKWSLNTTYKSTEVTGLKYQDGYVSNYVTYGKRSDSLSYMPLVANQTEVFDVIVFRELDPMPYAAKLRGTIALADSKERLGFNVDDKAVWSAGYQLVRIPRMDKADICMAYPSRWYAGDGMYPTDMVWMVIGLDDVKVTQKVITAFSKATQGVGALIQNTDAFTLSPPSFTTTGKSRGSIAQVLGFAVRKGHVQIAASCDAGDESCVTTTMRDDLFNAIDPTYPADGSDIFSGMCCDSLEPTLLAGGNFVDVFSDPVGEPFIIYRSLQDAGANIDTDKLTNLKAKYSNQYDATDGYIHWGKYGHWRPRTDAGASGGQYYEAAGDWVTTTTARFVVPAGHSAATITLHYRKATNYGKVIVKKNGTAVTGSPLDLYAASPVFSSTVLTETVSEGDVITLEATNTKNASSTSYRFSLDKIVVGASTYEENDSSGVFQCGSIGGDCLNGYTRGWKRWKSPGLVLIPEFISRSVYKESVLTDAQIRSHIGNMPTGNMGNGTFNDYYMMETDECVPIGYYYLGGCGYYQNGGSWFVFDAVPLRLASSYMTDDPLFYKWDEKNNKMALSGTWATETGAYYQQYVWKSSTAASTIEFSKVHLSDAWVYMITGAGQGTAKIYFDNGGGYDAGTTVDLSAVSNPVYSQTGLTYGANYRIKIEVVSGTVRLDYIKTKTKPSYLLSERRKQEFEITPWTKEWMHQDYASSTYKTSVGTSVDYYGWNILYGGLSAYPKFRWMMNDIYLRRAN